MSEIKELSTTLPFWNEVSSTSKDKLTSTAVEHKYDAGHILHAGKDDCIGVFVIKSGRVRVYTVTEQGREVTLFRLLDRDVCIFSASCMMKNVNFDIWIATETEAQSILIPTHIFRALAKEEISVSNFMNDILTSRMSDIMWVLEQILFMSLDVRLGLFLLEQSQLEETDTLNITHEEIANHLGTAREVVSRMLKHLASDNLIAVKRGSLIITDKKKLEDLCYKKK